MPVDSIATALSHPRITAVPAFSDNYIWVLRSRDGRRCAVVDPGDAAPVRDWLAANDCTLAWILVTHHHADHTGGIVDLKTPGVRVVGPRHEAIPLLDQPAGDGDLLDLAGLDCRLRVLDVPGHTAGHIAFHGEIDGQPVLFCGDTLFSAGCGRLFEGTPGEMADSLARLAGLAPQTLVYCTHEYTLGNLRFASAVEPGNADIARHADWARARREAGLATVPSDLARERRINPFLRCDIPAVARTVVPAAGPDPGHHAVFAALRRMKDSFR